MEFEKVIKERYSVRNFTEKEIEQEKLDKIISAAVISPTAKNIQPQKIFIIKSDEALAKVKEVTKCTYNAKIVLMCCYDSNLSWKNTASKEDSGIEDVSICTTHMMLEAWNLGIGSCWVNLYDTNKLKNMFNLPSNIVPVCLLPIGYPSKDSKPIPMHFEKKPKEEIFVEL